jgi:hypothetical protein
VRERGGNQGGTFGDQEDWFRTEEQHPPEDSFRRTFPPAQVRDQRPPAKSSRTGWIVASVVVVAVGVAGWGAYAAGAFKNQTPTSRPTSGAAAMGKSQQSGGATSGATTAAPAAQQVAWKAGLAAISNGTKTVTFGGVSVTFPTTVSDAAFSPDGSQLAFIDGDGDVAVSRLDGSGLEKVAKRKPGETYSRPAWGDGISIYFDFADSSGRTIFESSPPSPPDGSTVRPDDRWVADGRSDQSNALNADVQVFQKPGKSGPEVWRQDFDRSKQQPVYTKIADGSEPAVSPDGKRIAFVGAAGAIEVTTASGKPSKIATSLGATHLAWTPDGKSVAFSTSTGINQVSVSGGSATQVSTSPGSVTFLPVPIDRTVEIDGDLVAESIAASQARWPSQQSTHLPTGFGSVDDDLAVTVVLGAKEHPELALAAGFSTQPAAHNGPLLFTAGSSLDPATAAEIKRVLGTPNPGAADYNTSNGGHDVDSVILLGGTEVVSSSVEAAIKSLGYSTIREDATDQFAMAAKIGPSGVGSIAPNVVVASAADPAGIAAGITTGDTVIITDGSTMPPAMQKILDTGPSGPGGAGPGPVTLLPVDADAKAAIATTWPGKPTTFKVRDLSAKGPGAASAALLQTHTWYPAAVIVVPKSSVSDAVLAAAMARTMPLDTAVLAVDPTTGLDEDTAAILKQNSAAITTVYFMDGAGTIPQAVRNQFGSAIGGPLGYATMTNPQAGTTNR